MFHLPAVPVAQSVADYVYIERTKEGWWNGYGWIEVGYGLYVHIYIHTTPEFVKID
jgi:hypothetical protein